MSAEVGDDRLDEWGGRADGGVDMFPPQPTSLKREM